MYFPDTLSASMSTANLLSLAIPAILSSPPPGVSLTALIIEVPRGKMQTLFPKTKAAPRFLPQGAASLLFHLCQPATSPADAAPAGWGEASGSPVTGPSPRHLGPLLGQAAEMSSMSTSPVSPSRRPNLSNSRNGRPWPSSSSARVVHPELHHPVGPAKGLLAGDALPVLPGLLLVGSRRPPAHRRSSAPWGPETIRYSSPPPRRPPGSPGGSPGRR